jgi:hypothetical protein
VLEIDEGELNSEFSSVASYEKESLSMAHTVTYASDNIISGKVYSFRFKAFNSKGFSDYSEILRVAATSVPAKAQTPLVDYSFSSETSIYVSWELNKDGLGEGGKISGYKLYMDDGKGGDFAVVFDSVGSNAQINSFRATQLKTAL